MSQRPENQSTSDRYIEFAPVTAYLIIRGSCSNADCKFQGKNSPQIDYVTGTRNVDADGRISDNITPLSPTDIEFNRSVAESTAQSALDFEHKLHHPTCRGQLSFSTPL